MNNIYIATKLIGDTYFKQIQNQNEVIQNWLVHKLKHTFQVASNIMDIFFQEKEIFKLFSEEEKNFVEIVAILHDLGRFYQYKNGEIIDNNEFDHGKYAVELLKTDSRFNNPIILFAIEEHNKIQINYENPYYKNLSEHDKKIADIIAKLIRDADKLDNIKFFVYHDTHKFRLNKIGALSEEVKKQIIAKEQVDYAVIQNLADKVANGLSWINDIYFESTKKQIRDIKYIEYGIALAKKYGATEEDCELLRKYLKV